MWPSTLGGLDVFQTVIVASHLLPDLSLFSDLPKQSSEQVTGFVVLVEDPL